MPIFSDPNQSDEKILEEEQKKYIIQTYYDLIKALKENSSWLEQLRHLILTEELIELPKKFELLLKEVQEVKKEVKDLRSDFETFKREEFLPLKQKVENIEKDVVVLKQDVAVLKQDVAVLKQDVAVLKQDVAVLKQDVEILKKEVGVLKVDVGSLKGDNFERKVRERAPAYFGRYFRKVRVIPIEDWAEKLEDALDQNLISEEERIRALNLDVLISCKKKGEDNPLLLVVEASYTAEEKDIIRAMERAEIFFRVYQVKTIPVIISKEIRPNLEENFKEVLFIKVELE